MKDNLSAETRILLVDLQIRVLNVQNAFFPTDIQDYLH